MEEDSQFSRSEALLGAEAMKRLASAHVLLVGVGGVGSWCAEALVRTGLGHITLIDDDVVVESNLNRQCPAMTATLGRPKVEAMKERLLAINPVCEVIARCVRYNGEEESFPLHDKGQFHLILDAIDSVDCKAELVLAATEAGIPIVSSMGAALRTDPTKVQVTRFEKVEGDGLAKALRQRFKKLQRFPSARFNCVWSREVVLGACSFTEAERIPLLHSGTRGSLMPVTATFGMCLASEAIRHLTYNDNSQLQLSTGKTQKG